MYFLTFFFSFVGCCGVSVSVLMHVSSVLICMLLGEFSHGCPDPTRSISDFSIDADFVDICCWFKVV